MTTKATLLVADKMEAAQEVRGERFAMEGYKVVRSSSLEQTRQYLNKGNIDLAIIDLGMEDDEDEQDTSVLELAKNIAPGVPKIVIISSPTWPVVRETLRHNPSEIESQKNFSAKMRHFTAYMHLLNRRLLRRSRPMLAPQKHSKQYWRSNTNTMLMFPEKQGLSPGYGVA